MKKILLWVLVLWFLFSFSYGAVLSLSPAKWNIPENCVQAFNVNLNMTEWDEAITADLVVSSNMEFDRFENGDRFKYAAPERVEWDTVTILLFNDMWWEIREWGLVGTLYYKTRDVSDPYINFVFYDKWETIDTNINIAWMDILDHVVSWQYTLSSDIVCENPIVENYDFSEEDKMDKFIQQFESDHKNEKFIFFWNTYKWYILWIAWLLIIIIVLVSYKAQKKW